MPELPFRKPLALIASLLALAGTVAQAADNGSVVVSAFVPSKSNCKFNSGTLALPFGNVNPASVVNATASASTTFRCSGSAPLATFSITASNGLYSTAPDARRMQHATVPTEFMAYSLTLSPTSATVRKGVDQTLTVMGTIQPSAFQNVPAGTYQDTVLITLTP